MSLRKDLAAREADLRKISEQLDREHDSIVQHADKLHRSRGDFLKHVESEAQFSFSSNFQDFDDDDPTSLPPNDRQATGLSSNTEAATNIEADIVPELGEKAATRYMKARISALEEELRDSITVQKDLAKQLEATQVQLGTGNDERKRAEKHMENEKQAHLKTKKRLDDSKEKLERLQLELAGTRKDLEISRKEAKQCATEARSQEVRLQRALAEIEKLREQSSAIQSHRREGADGTKKERDILLAENKKLERQKGELLTAFRKQLKLIDILKRQKIHMEAAKQLSFTEEEFNKIIDMDF